MLRLTLKMAVIGSLSVLLLIPTAFICTLTKERSDRRQETIRKSSQAWGSAHVLAGPVLQVGSRQYFPELIKIDAAVQAESRHRGIYEIPFYSADVELTATYNLPADLAKASITLHGLRISETEIQSALLNNSWLSLSGEASSPQISGTAALPAGKNTITMKFKLLGTQRLHVLPAGNRTELRITSNWPHPNFSGAALPAEREVKTDGFKASWIINNVNPASMAPELARYEHEKGEDAEDIQSSGVDFFVPVDMYARIERAVKYAALFISLTFLTFFVFEAVAGLTIHPVQYLFVGLALSLFFLLLLSLAEHTGFEAAYALAMTGCVGLIGLYSQIFLKSRRRTLLLGGILTALYGFLYIVLVLEMYSLLAGSLGLFVILALTMYATRNIDWYKDSN